MSYTHTMNFDYICLPWLCLCLPYHFFFCFCYNPRSPISGVYTYIGVGPSIGAGPNYHSYTPVETDSDSSSCYHLSVIPPSCRCGTSWTLFSSILEWWLALHHKGLTWQTTGAESEGLQWFLSHLEDAVSHWSYWLPGSYTLSVPSSMLFAKLWGMSVI